MPSTSTTKKPRGRPPAAKSASSSGARPAPVKGLDRSLALLDVLSRENGLTLSEVAVRAQIAASTAHRILTTLEAHKFVRQDEDSELWSIGLKAFQIGSAFLRGRKVVDAGRPAMRDLLRRSGETVNLAIEDDYAIVYISQMESPSSIRAVHRPGSRSPAHSSAVGKMLLAGLPEKEARAFLAHTGMAPFTPTTITDAQTLLNELAQVRKCGWSVDNEEHIEGMRCIASAVYNEHGEAIAGLSISGPVNRLTTERIDELGPLVARAGHDITAAIGGIKPQ